MSSRSTQARRQPCALHQLPLAGRPGLWPSGPHGHQQLTCSLASPHAQLLSPSRASQNYQSREEAGGAKPPDREAFASLGE